MSQEVYNKAEVEGLLAKRDKQFEDRLARAERKAGFTVSAVAYNPETKYTYEDDGHGLIPRWDNPIMDHEKWMSIYAPNAEQKKALAGSTDHDLEEDCYTDEWRGKYQDFKSQLNEAIRTRNHALAGAVITSNDFAGLTTNVNISRVIGFQLVDNVLEQAISSQAAPNLKASYRNWVGFEVMPNVPEGVIVEAKKGTMTETSFTIKKDVGAAAITIEAELTIPLAVQDVFGDHVRWIALKMKKERAKKIVATLATSSNTQPALGLWDAFTGDHNTNDPKLDFIDAISTLAENNYSLNTLVSAAKPKLTYLSSTRIVGLFGVGPAAQRSPNVLGGVPGIDSAPTWYVDADITPATIVYAFDKQVVVMFEGPKRQVEIQRPDAEVREYYSRDFNTPYIVDQNGIVQITTTNA
jgi:hypothetical protein